jgi:small subunit ribosomal protein S20
MPNIASSKKRVRTTAKRTVINTARKTRVRGFMRKVEQGRAAQEYRLAEGVTPHQARRKTVKVKKPLESLRIQVKIKARHRNRAFFICQCAECPEKAIFRRRNTDDLKAK